MTDNVAVSGPVTVRADSSHRVAYELMEKIAGREEANDAQKKTRDYWLTLYFQCHKATVSNSLESILKRS